MFLKLNANKKVLNVKNFITWSFVL